jgi:hypothetical protein
MMLDWTESDLGKDLVGGGGPDKRIGVLFSGQCSRGSQRGAFTCSRRWRGVFAPWQAVMSRTKVSIEQGQKTRPRSSG